MCVCEFVSVDSPVPSYNPRKFLRQFMAHCLVPLSLALSPLSCIDHCVLIIVGLTISPSSLPGGRSVQLVCPQTAVGFHPGGGGSVHNQQPPISATSQVLKKSILFHHARSSICMYFSSSSSNGLGGAGSILCSQSSCLRAEMTQALLVGSGMTRESLVVAFS